jgi:hypothetical protein
MEGGAHPISAALAALGREPWDFALGRRRGSARLDRAAKTA